MSGVSAGGFRLGVDFGTSNTVAVLRWPEGRTRPPLFDASPLLPSAVYAEPGAGLAVGRGAVLAGRVRPERYEPHPKRCIDHGRVPLGDPGGVPVEALIEAVLARVAGEAARIAGGPVTHTALGCPAGWAATRRRTLTDAASRVFPRLSVVAEPVAAASHFGAAGRAVPPGGYAMVYDLGAGTFDASVVRRVGQSFEVLAVEGLADAGGLDIDAAMVAYLGATYAARDPATWTRLTDPASTADRRAVRARAARTARPPDPAAHRRGLPVCLHTAGVAPRDLAGLFLVGGASRIPFATTLLHRELGLVPTTIEQPELAVAEGSLHALPRLGPAPPVSGRPPPVPGRPLSGPLSAPPAAAAPPPMGIVIGAAVAVVAVLIGLAIAAIVLDDQRDNPTGLNPGGGSSQSSSDTAGGSLGERPAEPSTEAAIDGCLLGTWIETRHTIPLPHYSYTLTGSGAVHRVRPDGAASVDYGEGTAFVNQAQLPGFRIIYKGRITHKILTMDGRIHTRDAKAEGTVSTEYNGREVAGEKLRAAPGPFDYRCAGNSLTITLPDQEITLERTST